jgi:hypothetical protein
MRFNAVSEGTGCDAKTGIWRPRNDLTFDGMESAFRNWMSSLAWVIKNDGEHTFALINNNFRMMRVSENLRGTRNFLPCALDSVHGSEVTRFRARVRREQSNLMVQIYTC